MFTLAKKRGLVNVNPVPMTDKPRKGEFDPTPVQLPWSEEEAAEAVMALRGTNLYVPVLLLINSGLRFGELAALQWEDIDWQSHSISVERTGSYTSILQPDGSTVYGFEVRKPKTKTSRRTLQLSSPMIDELRVHEVEQSVRVKAKGPSWKNSGFVFTNEVGGPVDASRFRKQFYRRLKEKGIRPIRLHDIRHSFATILIERDSGMLSAVSKALGHSSVSITLDVYANTAKIDNQATLAMGEIVFPDKKKVSPTPLIQEQPRPPVIVENPHAWRSGSSR
jgi:integrase